MAYDRLRKMLGGDSIERDIEKEGSDLDRLKEKKKEAELMRSIGRFTDSLQGIATLHGKAPRVDAEASYAPMVEEADRDIGRSHNRRKDLLGKLQTIEGIDAQQADKQYKHSEEERRHKEKLAAITGKIDPTKAPVGSIAQKDWQKIATEHAGKFTTHTNLQRSLSSLQAIIDEQRHGLLGQTLARITGTDAEKRQKIINAVYGVLKAKDPTSVVSGPEFENIVDRIGIENFLASPDALIKNIEALKKNFNKDRETEINTLRSVYGSLGAGRQFDELIQGFSGEPEEETITETVVPNAQADQGKPRISATGADRKKLQSAEVGNKVTLSDGDVALIIKGEDGKKTFKLKSEYPNEKEWLALIEETIQPTPEETIQPTPERRGVRPVMGW